MNVSNGSAHVILSEEDYPWLFLPDTSLKLQRTNQVGDVKEAHVEPYVKPDQKNLRQALSEDA